MRLRRLAHGSLCVCLLGALITSACGSSGSSPATPTPAPATPPIFVNMVGTWTGSLKSSNYPDRTVTMTVVQASNCVDGAWSGTPSGWTGAISGFATDGGYTGQISIDFTLDTGERCRGASDVFSGPVSATDLTWNVSAFTLGVTCSQPLPRDVVLTLHRQ